MVTSTQSELGLQALPYRFHDLKSFTREEALLLNWFSRNVSADTDWKSCLTEVLGHLLERPAGKQFQLVQRHLLDPQFGEKVLQFGGKQEISIGHDGANEIVLSANAIAGKHARLVLKSSELTLEDLGSRLGTYLWDRKVVPNHAEKLTEGDQFTVFPYRFRVEFAQTWEPETKIRISDCHIKAVPASSVFEMSAAEWKAFVLKAHPDNEQVFLQANTAFLNELQHRILAPLGLRHPADPVASDDGLVLFIALAALERLNRSLQFPLQFSLARFVRSTFVDQGRGYLLTIAIGVGDLVGKMRLFVPIDLIATLRSGTSRPARTGGPDGLCWNFPLAVGFADLSTSELRQVEIGDAVLLHQDASLLFPQNPAIGWNLKVETSNFVRFKVDKYFERMASVQDASLPVCEKPPVESLPIRLHVIVGEKELTLAEIRSLTSGTIVELGASKLDPVQLMINGKILGDGELVDVEGNLAVRVLHWRSA